MTAAPTAERPLTLHVVLADRGTQDVGSGKLNLLGAGFSTSLALPTPAGLAVAPHVIAVFVMAPWRMANKTLDVKVELLDEDGHVVTLPGVGEPQRLSLAAQVMVSPPPGAPNGTPCTAKVMMDLGIPLPLQTGRSYLWRATAAEVVGEAGFWVPNPLAPPRIS